MIRVTEAQYLNDFRIHVTLSDGTSGTVDLRGRLDGPIFQPLNDPKYFAEFELTDHTLQWPNGADFAPEYLRDLISGSDAANHAMQRSGGGDVSGHGGSTPAAR